MTIAPIKTTHRAQTAMTLLTVFVCGDAEDTAPFAAAMRSAILILIYKINSISTIDLSGGKLIRYPY
jgi:hypothetical protein